MIEVRMTFASPQEVVEFFAGASLPNVDARGLSAAEAALPPTQKRSKKGKAAETLADGPQPAGVGGSAADPLAGMLAPQAPVMQAPAAMQQAAPTPAAAQPPTAVEQKHLIAAFTKLGQTKGRDAFAPVLANFGATAVIGPAGVGIAQDRWPEAIVLCAQALGVEPAAFLASLR